MRRSGNRRYASRQDSNHVQICKGLRELGYHVLDLKSVGGGCPDIAVVSKQMLWTEAVGWLNQWWLVEIKSSPKAKLNAKQIKWRENWTGPAPITACSLEEILEAIQK